MMTYDDFASLSLTAPAQAQRIWKSGTPIRYRTKHLREAAGRITSTDFSKGRNAALSALARPLARGGRITISPDLLGSISFATEADDPPATAMMTGVELVALAVGVAGLALAIGILVEGAMDEDSGGGIVVENGDGSVTINQGGGDGDGDGDGEEK